MRQKVGHTGEQSIYQSYLLRLWQVNKGEGGWRASLESAQPGARRGFATLDALFDHIRSRTRDGSSLGSGGEGDRR